MSPDHNQQAHYFPQDQLNSSKVFFDPIFVNTNIDEVGLVFNFEIDSYLRETVHEIDPYLHEITNTPNIRPTIFQVNKDLYELRQSLQNMIMLGLLCL